MHFKLQVRFISSVYSDLFHKKWHSSTVAKFYCVFSRFERLSLRQSEYVEICTDCIFDFDKRNSISSGTQILTLTLISYHIGKTELKKNIIPLK